MKHLKCRKECNNSFITANFQIAQKVMWVYFSWFPQMEGFLLTGKFPGVLSLQISL